jgi:hypothetical protein
MIAANARSKPGRTPWFFPLCMDEKCFSAEIDSGGAPRKDIIASNLYKLYAAQSYRIQELAKAVEGVSFAASHGGNRIWENAWRISLELLWLPL